MHVTPLHDNWQFRCATPGVGYWRPNQPANPWREALVPGHVHLDLMIDGVIPDPFELEHEAGCQWVSEEDWEYRTVFNWSPKPGASRRVLRFEGLDTVATITLNGSEIARHDNMHVPLEIDVTGKLTEGENELIVKLESPVRVGMERRKAYFEAEGIAHGTNWFDERAFLRKVACMSGWDWGPRLVSCGIWRPVSLLEYESRIVSFTVFQEPSGPGFRIWSETVIEGNATFKTSFDGQIFDGDFDFVIEDAKLWWPVGEGEAHLYDATATLSSGQRIEKKVGLRSIRLLREPDELGESFEFEVNGRRIYARGANWIPNDSFPSVVSDEDYEYQVQSCAALGMNILRVWGGGLYELEGFYDSCDRAGILVWQDFPHACAYYPDGPAAQAVAKLEAEVQVRRLRDRTCLALWCGNNENDVMWQGKWGGPEGAPPRYYGDELYGKVYPEVCARLDPNRPYIRSSPIGHHDGDKAYGDEHYWDVWHGRGDWKFYAESNTRFSSEFGFASAAGTSCWLSAGMVPSELSPDDLPVRWHDKTNKPWDVYRGMVELHYPSSETLDDWIYRSQLNQRDALRFGIEHYRTNAYCRGVLIWQFNDCWPVQSWAVQDYSRELKIAGFELERLYAPTLVSLKIEGGIAIVTLAHEGPRPFSGTVTVKLFDVDGTETQAMRFEANLAAGDRTELARIDLGPFEAKRTVLCAQIEGQQGSQTWRTAAEPKEMAWIKPRLTLESNRLKVEGLAYDLVLDDPHSGQTVAYENAELAGLEARTLVDEEVALSLDGSEQTIRAKTLAGTVEFEIGS
ncbi:MAG TPA: hypothetical protein PLX06_01840 [Fimbriimonadaceae bacterium]|nr:hypothetical protein [Fimbriimonadaceae bacterium]